MRKHEAANGAKAAQDNPSAAFVLPAYSDLGQISMDFQNQLTAYRTRSSRDQDSLYWGMKDFALNRVSGRPQGAVANKR